MGRDMSAMTAAVQPIGFDDNSMTNDMGQMTGEMRVLAKSMAEGGISVDFVRVRVGLERMTGDVSKMAGNVGA